MKTYCVVTIGKVLRKLRETQNLSQQLLAERSSLDRSYISLLERGLKRPSLHTTFALATGLGIPAYKLVQEIEEHIRNEMLGRTSADLHPNTLGAMIEPILIT